MRRKCGEGFSAFFSLRFWKEIFPEAALVWRTGRSRAVKSRVQCSVAEWKAQRPLTERAAKAEAQGEGGARGNFLWWAGVFFALRVMCIMVLLVGCESSILTAYQEKRRCLLPGAIQSA